MKVDVYHNIRWSRYKAAVFSELFRIAIKKNDDFRFTQIADTSGQRASLSNVDLSWHKYPHAILFPGDYDNIPKVTLCSTLFMRVFRSDAQLILIQGFDQPEHWAMLFAAILSKKKRATFCDSTLKDHFQSKFKGVFKRLFFSLCDGVFCYGERAREYLLHYGVKADHIFQRFQAAALPESYVEDNVNAARLQSESDRLNPSILYVGRLSLEKGLGTLLQAFAVLSLKFPQSRLILVGGGPLEAALKAIVKEMRLTDQVTFAGGASQEALANYYLSATCLVLPSRSEPWGLVVNEALHYGCPVVVSDNCGCVPELVHDGVTGYSFQTDSAADLAHQLLQIASNFPDTHTVTTRCLNVIRPYKPETAAHQMHKGCSAIITSASPA